jgi:hypothetical protein
MQARWGLVGATAMLLCMSSVARSDEAGAVAQVLQSLRSQGYREIWFERTLLNRVRIVAERRGTSREIVLDPRTGDILRDYSESEDDSVPAGASGGIVSGEDGHARDRSDDHSEGGETHDSDGQDGSDD